MLRGQKEEKVRVGGVIGEGFVAEFLRQIWKEGRTQNKVRAGCLEESKIAKHGDQGGVHTVGDESQERGKGAFPPKTVILNQG